MGTSLLGYFDRLGVDVGLARAGGWCGHTDGVTVAVAVAVAVAVLVAVAVAVDVAEAVAVALAVAVCVPVGVAVAGAVGVGLKTGWSNFSTRLWRHHADCTYWWR